MHDVINNTISDKNVIDELMEQVRNAERRLDRDVV